MIKHEAFVNLYNKNKEIFNILFTDTLTLSKLTSNIIKLSKQFKSLGYKDDNKVKGDLFEIFAECFFKILSSDNRIGVYDYVPGDTNDDYGVDGFGIGMDGKPLTVQVKFRSNTTTELTSDDIKQFAMQSIINYSVDKDTRTNMIVFTNASGLHYITETIVFGGRVKAIGNNNIKGLVDNNTVFWRNLNDLVAKTIEVKYN